MVVAATAAVATAGGGGRGGGRGGESCFPVFCPSWHCPFRDVLAHLPLPCMCQVFCCPLLGQIGFHARASAGQIHTCSLCSPCQPAVCMPCWLTACVLCGDPTGGGYDQGGY